MENRKLFASEWHEVAGLIDEFRKQSAEALFCFIRNATTEEKDANGRLIAAAPDMYNLLRAIEFDLHSIPHRLANDISALLSRIDGEENNNA